MGAESGFIRGRATGCSRGVPTIDQLLCSQSEELGDIEFVTRQEAGPNSAHKANFLSKRTALRLIWLYSSNVRIFDVRCDVGGGWSVKKSHTGWTCLEVFKYIEGQSTSSWPQRSRRFRKNQALIGT